MTQDPYAALGLSKGATAEEIKKAYRKIARVNHPDLNPDNPEAEELFKDAGRAYDLLKDPEQRRRFDAGEIDATGAEQAPRGYYRDEARRPENPYTQNRSSTGGDPFGEGFDADDFFAQFARSRGAGQGRASRGDWPGGDRSGRDRPDVDWPGQNTQYRLSLAFLDAARGTKTRITLPDGNSLEVTIPEGARDGQTLRLRGKGEAGLGAGPAGDAFITLDVTPSAEFERDGDDILVTLPISIDEAILGGKVPVNTVTGAVSVTVPPGASSGQVLRLKGRGVKGRTGKGDQRITLRIVSPPQIDDALKHFMEGWRKDHAYNPRAGKETS
ncbi:DnaJ C-terminal domain-containing protein [Pseudophaeobacter leonis]|uniref:DnaJ C-terminal domain-containing protein n=1 Tax=Pseudophaeobacter leonis TaxID=1144477 RepID=UPI0009F5A99A|nr:J domain-containing protein [Pseudophaeobacter leonis]